MLADVRKTLGHITRFKEGGLIAIIVLFGLFLALFSGTVTYYDPSTGAETQLNRFLQPGNLDKLVKNTSFFAIMAVGATLVIISGGIDLSVGSVYCLAAVCGAMYLNHFGPGPAGDQIVGHPWLVVSGGVLLCMLVGTFCGFVNGVLTTSLRLHPFIITLGTMSIYRGIAFIMTKAQAFTFFPPQFTDGLIRYRVGANIYPAPMFIMAAVTVAGILLLNKTINGRYVYAVGGNEVASRFSGVRVTRVKVLVYSIAGLTAGIAAMIMLGYYGSASSDVGKGYELDVIAASVVGGASLNGGRGTAIGALLGALIIQMINNSIVILGIDQNYSQVIMGAVIIIAVSIDRIGTFLRERQMARGA